MPHYINGFTVEFPHQPYGVQYSFMAKMLSALANEENALLEAPTGCGKTLSLLCAALAWQTKKKCILQVFIQQREEKRVTKLVAEQEARLAMERAGQLPQATHPVAGAPARMSKGIPTKATYKLSAPGLLAKPGYVSCVRGGSNKPGYENGALLTAKFAAAALGRTLATDGPRAAAAPVAAMATTVEPEALSQAYTPPEEAEELAPVVPKIYFATRTHSQIAQVVRELKRSGYNPRMAILAARTHYCINKAVKATGRVDEACKALAQERFGCRFQKKQGEHQAPPIQVHDIEELTACCTRAKMCPYFAARSLAEAAELVFCPYSYLLDPLVREAMAMDLKDAVVIFDEAHNIEDVAREAGSLEQDLSTLQLAWATLERSVEFSSTPDLYRPLAEAASHVVAWLKDVALGSAMQPAGFEVSEVIWVGQEALSQLAAAGLGPDSVAQLSRVLAQAKQNEAKATFATEGEAADKAPPVDMVSAGGGGALVVMDRLLVVLGMMYGNPAGGTPDRVVDYRVAVKRWIARTRGGGGRDRGRQGLLEGVVAEEVTQLCLWCMNPAVAFQQVAGPSSSVVLTSGTLSPLDSFASELGTDFHTTLEAPHVVDMQKQVWAGVVPCSPSGTLLTATFKAASTFDFQDGVGDSVLRCCQAIPDGVLLFLPSYGLMDKLVTRWKDSGLWGQLARVKAIVCEPREAGKDFTAAMNQYYTAVASGRGALLLAVCRGKASEGIDFADAHARGVLIIGIPFPAVKDTKVRLKKAFNDASSAQRAPRQRLLSGELWYTQQAFRALNQAVGRCIRHKYDYGAIVLLDERFRQLRHQKHLSRWVRGAITVQADFDMAMSSLANFFEVLKQNPPHRTPSPHTPATTPSMDSLHSPQQQQQQEHSMQQQEHTMQQQQQRRQVFAGSTMTKPEQAGFVAVASFKTHGATSVKSLWDRFKAQARGLSPAGSLVMTGVDRPKLTLTYDKDKVGQTLEQVAGRQAGCASSSPACGTPAQAGDRYLIAVGGCEGGASPAVTLCRTDGHSDSGRTGGTGHPSAAASSCGPLAPACRMGWGSDVEPVPVIVAPAPASAAAIPVGPCHAATMAKAELLGAPDDKQTPPPMPAGLWGSTAAASAAPTAQTPVAPHQQQPQQGWQQPQHFSLHQPQLQQGSVLDFLLPKHAQEQQRSLDADQDELCGNWQQQQIHQQQSMQQQKQRSQQSNLLQQQLLESAQQQQRRQPHVFQPIGGENPALTSVGQALPNGSGAAAAVAPAAALPDASPAPAPVLAVVITQHDHASGPSAAAPAATTAERQAGSLPCELACSTSRQDSCNTTAAVAAEWLVQALAVHCVHVRAEEVGHWAQQDLRTYCNYLRNNPTLGLSSIQESACAGVLEFFSWLLEGLQTCANGSSASGVGSRANLAELARGWLCATPRGFQALLECSSSGLPLHRQQLLTQLMQQAYEPALQHVLTAVSIKACMLCTASHTSCNHGLQSVDACCLGAQQQLHEQHYQQQVCLYPSEHGQQQQQQRQQQVATGEIDNHHVPPLAVNQLQQSDLLLPSTSRSSPLPTTAIPNLATMSAACVSHVDVSAAIASPSSFASVGGNIIAKSSAAVMAGIGRCSAGLEAAVTGPATPGPKAQQLQTQELCGTSVSQAQQLGWSLWGLPLLPLPALRGQCLAEPQQWLQASRPLSPQEQLKAPQPWAQAGIEEPQASLRQPAPANRHLQLQLQTQTTSLRRQLCTQRLNPQAPCQPQAPTQPGDRSKPHGQHTALGKQQPTAQVPPESLVRPLQSDQCSAAQPPNGHQAPQAVLNSQAVQAPPSALQPLTHAQAAADGLAMAPQLAAPLQQPKVQHTSAAPPVGQQTGQPLGALWPAGSAVRKRKLTSGHAKVVRQRRDDGGAPSFSEVRVKAAALWQGSGTKLTGKEVPSEANLKQHAPRKRQTRVDVGAQDDDFA